MKTIRNEKIDLPSGMVTYLMSRRRHGMEYRMQVTVNPYIQPRYEIAWALRDARLKLRYALEGMAWPNNLSEVVPRTRGRMQ